MFLEYIFIFKFSIFCFFFGLLLFCLSFFFVYQMPNFEKLSIYECGFNPFGDTRNKFEVKFYLVAILFIIFDLEVTYLFPWVLLFGCLNLFGIFCMLFFIFFLSLGFLYEWVCGALDW